MPGTVVITGAAGQLASAVRRAFDAGHRVVPLTRSDLDITADRAVETTLGALRPDLIVNCASYNDVDAAEQDPVRALEVNAFGVRTLARAARTLGAVLVHYSTDFVFDGTAVRPHTEDDLPNPQSVYAASKLLGEWFALEAPEAYVLRVESLFGAVGGHGRRTSLEKIVSGIDAGDEVPVFTDRTVSPCYVRDVAAATLKIFEQVPPQGVYHCVNTGAATWDTIAREAARLLGKPPRLRLLTMADVRLAALRPRYCAMSNTKLAAVGIEMPTWQDAISRYLSQNSESRIQNPNAPKNPEPSTSNPKPRTQNL
jgi:dTDP-4-dehydrorhamnose reductase